MRIQHREHHVRTILVIRRLHILHPVKQVRIRSNRRRKIRILSISRPMRVELIQHRKIKPWIVVRRIQFDRLLEAGDGLVHVALGLERTAQVAVGRRGAGAEPYLLASRDDGGLERLLGLARPPSRLERLAQATEMPGTAGT